MNFSTYSQKFDRIRERRWEKQDRIREAKRVAFAKKATEHELHTLRERWTRQDDKIVEKRVMKRRQDEIRKVIYFLHLERRREDERHFKEWGKEDRRKANERKKHDARVSEKRKEYDEKIANERKEYDARVAEKRKEYDEKIASERAKQSSERSARRKEEDTKYGVFGSDV